MNTKETTSKQRVLVGIDHTERPYHALIRGYRLAKACDADLVVVHVVTNPHAFSWMLFPHRHADAISDQIVRDLELIGTTAAWCDQILPEPLGDRYVVRRGKLADELAAEVERGPTRMVVIAAGSIEARHACELANDHQIPVLLARPRKLNSVVVAATDLRDERYPVLHEASEVAPAMAARLVCVHNRPPRLPGVDPMTAMFLPASDLRDDGDRGLESAADAVAEGAEVLTTNEARPVDAILDVARAQDADLIVVGAAPHSSIYRWLTGSTAAAVARRARRSVLLAPLSSPRTPN